MNDKWTFDGKGLGTPWAFALLGLQSEHRIGRQISVQTGSDLEVSWLGWTLIAPSASLSVRNPGVHAEIGRMDS